MVFGRFQARAAGFLHSAPNFGPETALFCRKYVLAADPRVGGDFVTRNMFRAKTQNFILKACLRRPGIAIWVQKEAF